MTAPRSTKRTPRIREHLPPPSSAEGELFSYTPDEAAQWLPFVARTLREMAYRREIPHVHNGRDMYFLGRHISEISKQFTVEPVADNGRPTSAAS